MSIDTAVLINIIWAAVTANLFAVLYPCLSPGWRKTWIGWGLLTSSTALALLLDLSLAGRVFGRNFLHYDALLFVVTLLVAIGASLKLTALLVTKARAMLARRV